MAAVGASFSNDFCHNAFQLKYIGTKRFTGPTADAQGFVYISFHYFTSFYSALSIGKAYNIFIDLANKQFLFKILAKNYIYLRILSYLERHALLLLMNLALKGFVFRAAN